MQNDPASLYTTISVSPDSLTSNDIGTYQFNLQMKVFECPGYVKKTFSVIIEAPVQSCHFETPLTVF